MIFRKKLPDIVVSSLLVVATAGAYPWLVYPLWRGHNLLIVRQGIQDSSAADYSVFIGAFALESLVPAVIGVAAISDAVRSRFRVGAMAGFGLAGAMNLVATLAVDLPSNFTSAWPSWNDHLFYVLLAAPVASGLLGWSLFYLIRPRWNRWFDVR